MERCTDCRESMLVKAIHQGNYNDIIQCNITNNKAGDLMGNPAARAGFASDGKITKRSTTQIITSSIETATHKLLRYSVGLVSHRMGRSRKDR